MFSVPEAIICGPGPRQLGGEMVLEARFAPDISVAAPKLASG